MAVSPIALLNAALGGRYSIEQELGQGGMATVYLADDLRHERKVALKLLKPELAAVVGAERFLAEIKTTANLQHPHILPLFDSGEVDGFLYYVMPYVEGESLRDRLDRERQLPVDDAVRIAHNLAEALDYAHRKGVIHRDIKPANVLLIDGKPVISDFGIALAVGAAGGGRLTETGLSLGTPHYMSPEQATGEAHVGPPADIYALGCVLYEIIVGNPPHVGTTAQAVLARIITEDPAPLTQGRKSVPANVDAAVRKALEKVPADRFASAAGFAKALTDPGFRHGDAEAESSAPQRRAMQLLPWLVAATGAALGLFGLLRGPTTVPTPGALRSDLLFPNDSGPAGRGLAFSPDGTELAYVSTVALDGGRIWIRSLETGDRRVLPGTEGALGPVWSQDGRIAFRVGRDEIKIVPAGGGPVTTAAHALGRPAWTSDGTLLFTDRGALASLSSGGPDVTIALPDSTRLGGFLPTPLPDRQAFLIQLIGRSGGIYEGTVSGAFTRVHPGGGDPRFVDGWLVFTRSEDRGRGLYAQRFDLRSKSVSGPEIPLATGIATPRGRAQFAISDHTLVYAPLQDARSPAKLWRSRDGEDLGDTGTDPGWMYDLARDGSQIAIGGWGLWVRDTDGGPPRRIVAAGEQAYNPRWSDDARKVLFRGGGGLRSIGTATGDTAILLLRASGNDVTRPVGWGPDGEVLFIETSQDGTSALRALDAGGAGDPRTVQPGATNARLSRDGVWLAYTAEEDDRQSEVYLRAYRGGGETIQVSSDGGMSPFWGPRGDELFFATPDGQGMVSSLSFDGGITASIPTALPVDIPLDPTSLPVAVHPDGRLLLDPAATRESLAVIRDWKALAERGS